MIQSIAHEKSVVSSQRRKSKISSAVLTKIVFLTWFVVLLILISYEFRILQSDHATVTLQENPGPRYIGAQNHKPILPALPKRVYSVIGLEDSGTNYVAKVITDALHQKEYRDGAFPFNNTKYDYLDTQVQHFSLPWGETCHSKLLNGEVPYLDVVLPSYCYRTSGNPYKGECSKVAQDLWGISLDVNKEIKNEAVRKYYEANKSVPYFPLRFNLDIVSYKEWYDALGVEQYIIIVIRDQNISRRSRSSLHCQNPTLLAKEEKAGNKSIMDAIYKYILEKNETQHRRVKPEELTFWNSDLYFETRSRTTRNERPKSKSHGRRLSSSSLSDTISIPHKNNVVLVSYESLMFLGDEYVRSLLNVLGIKSSPRLEMRDANEKHVGSPNKESSKKGSKGDILKKSSFIADRKEEVTVNENGVDDDDDDEKNGNAKEVSDKSSPRLEMRDANKKHIGSPNKESSKKGSKGDILDILKKGTFITDRKEEVTVNENGVDDDDDDEKNGNATEVSDLGKEDFDNDEDLLEHIDHEKSRVYNG